MPLLDNRILKATSRHAIARAQEHARNPLAFAAIYTREMARGPYLRRYGRIGAQAFLKMTGKEVGHHGFSR